MCCVLDTAEQPVPRKAHWERWRGLTDKRNCGKISMKSGKTCVGFFVVGQSTRILTTCVSRCGKKSRAIGSVPRVFPDS
jgi:hypothetical protein